MGRKHESQKTVAEKKADFRSHLRTYLVMSVFFVLLNYFGGSRHFWAIWPIMGWGIGVALQGLSLYGPLADKHNPNAGRTHQDTDDDFAGPLPDVVVTDEDLRRRREARELRELNEDTRPYGEDDLV